MINKKVSLTVLVFLSGMACISFAEQVIYVDGDANGLNNGSSWVNAYRFLQDGLAVAEDGDEMWVAEGSYKPDEGSFNEGLSAWWRLDETSGNTAYDSSDNHYDGQLLGGAAWEPTGGKSQGAVRFEGGDERVEIPSTGISPSGGTVSLWGRAEGEQTQYYRYFFAVRDLPDGGNRIQLYLYQTTMQLGVGLGDTHKINTNVKVLNVNDWYHIALTWDEDVPGSGSGNWVIYVDGVEESSGTYSGLSSMTTGADIGNDHQDRDKGLHGLVDDVRIYDRVFDETEIGLLQSYFSGSREATFQMKSGVVIYGGFPSASDPNLSDPNYPNWNDRDPNTYETILSGNINSPWRASDNSYHVITGSGTDATAVLDGFTISGGKANGTAPDNSGGGIHDSYGTVVNCTFVGNSAEYGGGISHSYGPITDCVFFGNSADEQGGGIYRSYGAVTDCTFNMNWANDGSGIYRNHGAVTNCTFSKNTTSNDGGGIYDSYGGVINCRFYGNQASDFGGGIKHNHAQIINCIFNGNSTMYGGGIYRSYGTVSNCTFSSNTAYGYGGGIYDNYGAVSNCILWGNSDSSGTGGAAQIYHTDYWDITYCCVPGRWYMGNIGTDPLFVDPCGVDGIFGTEDDNLRLRSDSPCIDAGDNTTVSTDAADLDNDANRDERIPYDIDGWLRFVDDPCTYDAGVTDPPVYPDIVDMGAHERRALCPANYDLFRSGYVDWSDIGAFADEWSHDCNWANSWCGWVDFDKSGKVDFADFALFARHWLSDFLGELHKLEWADVMGRDWQLPAKLDDFIGVHPRYLLNDAKITALKGKVDTPGTTQEYIWLNVVKPMADDLLTQSPPGGGNEDVMRDSGRGIPWLALAYLMADEPEKTTYKYKAIDWMLTVCGYSSWVGNSSLGGAEGLVGVSIGYDWLYDELSDPQRETIKNKLIYQSQRMAPNPQHKERWLANHNHVEHNGLAAAGFVLYGEPGAEEASDWIRQADLVFQMAFVVGSSDGSSTEGHPYWGYSMESLLCYTEAARDLMGKDYYDSKWIEGATDFIIFCTIPDFNMITRIPEPNYSNCVMSFGDSYRDYRSHGPTHILCRVASEYNDGRAQWLADEMIDKGIGTTDIDYRAWANLLWYDEGVTATSLSGLPTFKHFEDIGLVISRSGWDEDAVMVGFKCGPFHGHKVQPYYEKQYAEGWPYYHTIVNGHCQPDVGSFQVYAHGKWLATEPGYSRYTSSRRKYTYDHCTILAGGLGQLGEYTPEDNSSWFDGEAVIDANASSSIIKAENCADYDYIVGDTKNIYRDWRLSKFIRHFVYIKPDVIVIADELEASPSSNYFQWRLRATHSRPQFVDEVNIVTVQDPNYYIIENNNEVSDVVVMDVHFVHPELANFSTGIETITQYKGNQSKFLAARFNSTSGGDMLATVLHPRRDEEPACSITSSSFVDSVLYLTIEIGVETINVELDLAAQEVTIY